ITSESGVDQPLKIRHVAAVIKAADIDSFNLYLVNVIGTATSISSSRSIAYCGSTKTNRHILHVSFDETDAVASTEAQPAAECTSFAPSNITMGNFWLLKLPVLK
ncbi:unnamed protein product, partial [Allacma fusca]